MSLLKHRAIKGLPFSIVQFGEIDSTNRFLKDYGHHSPENGLVVVAEAQTAGRGRFGKRWESPKGEGLYFSLLMHPVSPQRAMAIPLMAGVVLYQTMEDAFPALQSFLDLKWPNDVLLGRKKVAGILVELENLTDETLFVVVGVGVNCNQTSFPPELLDATSLRLHMRKEVDPASLLDAFLVRWHGYSAANDFSMDPGCRDAARGLPASAIAPSLAMVVSDWKNRSTFWKDRAVRFNFKGEILEGTTCDVAPSGGLLVRLKTGRVKELLSGEVEWISNR